MHEIFKEGENWLEKANKALLKQNWTLVDTHCEKAIQSFEQTRSFLRIADCYILLAKSNLMQENLEKSIQYYHKSLAAQRKTNNLKLVAQSHLNLSHLYYVIHNTEEAQYHAQLSYDFGEKLQDLGLKVHALYYQGKIAFYEEEIKSAIFYLDLALTDCNEMKTTNLKVKTKILTLLGTIHANQGENDLASLHFAKALKIYLKTQQYTKIAGLRYELSLLSYYIEDYQKALENLDKALRIQNSLTLPNKAQILCRFLYLKAKIYQIQGNFLMAEEICESCIELAEKNNLKRELTRCLLFMAQLQYNTLNEEYNDRTWQQYLGEAKDLSLKISDSVLHMKILLEEASFFAFLKEEKNLMQVEEKLKQILKKTTNPEINAEVNEYFGIKNHKSQQFEKALVYFQKSLDVKDAINDIEIRASICYNSACNFANLHQIESTIPLLKYCFKLLPRYRSIAREDPDLAQYWKLKQFQDLI